MTTNDLICSIRERWYDFYEPRRLAWERKKPILSQVPPLVSVYIPTHNRVQLLVSRALASVRKQDYPNLEIIIAAHGCTDLTVPVVRALADPRLRVIEVPRKRKYPPTAENHWLAGPVVPANAALRECRGDWIARIDDDDEWTEDHISVLLKFAKKWNYEFVSAAHMEVFDTPFGTQVKTVQPYIFAGTKVGGTQTWLYRSYLKFFKYNIDCWRKPWNKVNDTDLQDRMFRAGVHMGYLPEVVATIRPRPGETEIGSKAYLSNAEAKERQYAFK